MAEMQLLSGDGVFISQPRKAFVTVVAGETNQDSGFKIHTRLYERDGSELSQTDKDV